MKHAWGVSLLISCAQVPQPAVITYTNTVHTLFSNYCVTCHGPGSQRGNWLNYETAKSKSAAILERVYIKKDMPQGTFMSDSKRELIKRWIEQGCAE